MEAVFLGLHLAPRAFSLDERSEIFKRPLCCNLTKIHRHLFVDPQLSQYQAMMDLMHVFSHGHPPLKGGTLGLKHLSLD